MQIWSTYAIAANDQFITFFYSSAGLFLVLSFMLSWSPYAIVALINAFADPRNLPLGKNFGLWMDCVAPIFAKSSSCFSPFFFIISNRRYREALFQWNTKKQVNVFCLKVHWSNLSYHQIFSSHNIAPTWYKYLLFVYTKCNRNSIHKYTRFTAFPILEVLEATYCTQG